jgi:hypothetical protein
MVGRRSLASLVLLGLAGAPARAQDRPDIAKLREELMALERQSWEALKARDRAAVRRALPDDAQQIFAGGGRYFKSEILNHMPDYRLDNYEIDPQYGLRMISPDVAALLYRVTAEGAARLDRTISTKVLASSIYVRRDGKWWSVLYQETPVR